MTKLTRRTFAASAAAAADRRRPRLPDARARTGLSGAARHRHRAMGRGRRHRRDRAHRRGAARKGPRPAVQRGEPHRRLRRGRPLGHRDRRTRWLHHRHDHGGNHHDALAGPDRAQSEELHAARADERGSAGRHRQLILAVQDREGACRRHQGGARREAESLRHGPGRHLASGAGRLAQGDGTGAQSCRVGAVERRRARDAGSRGRRPRFVHLLHSGGARPYRGWQGAGTRPHGAGAQPGVQGHSDAQRSDGHRLFDRRVARHRGPEGPAGGRRHQAHRLAEEGLGLEGVQGLHEQPRLRRGVGRRSPVRELHGQGRRARWATP